MRHNGSPAQDSGHQPMGAVLPVPVCVVGERHRLHDDDAMLDGMIRLRPEDEVGHAGIAGFLVALRSVLDAQLTERGQTGAVCVSDPRQQSRSFDRGSSNGLGRCGGR